MQTIWVVPPPSIKRTLEIEVERLSEKYNSPIFEPHMTLLGDISMERNEFLTKVRKLAKMISPLSLSLGEVSFSTTFFQSVFVRVKSTAELMDANLQAKNMFGIENNVFMPHISLMYGEHSMKVRADASEGIQFPKENFICDTLTITQSSLNPSEWEHIEEIHLG